MRAWICMFLPHSWMHITDVICGKNRFDQPILIGLWQCNRCKQLSKGKLSTIPDEGQGKL